MKCFPKVKLLAGLAVCAGLTLANAGTADHSATDNSYYLYTGELEVSDSGVMEVPSRFKWSVETSWRGIDRQGQELPDTRVMLRLYDPTQNFNVLTAQMDLHTAEKLQLELADIIAKKRENPSYQHRPQLYDSKIIPIGSVTGIDNNGDAILELAPRRNN